MDFTPILTAMMGLDYNSSSIGIDFGAVAPGIKKIQIIPDGKFRAHRVTQRTLDLYTSPDNTIYTMASRSNWSFTADGNGVITITLKESVATRYLKIHVKFDERDSGFTAKNKATFLNDLAKMLRIYQEASSRTEEFHYYAAGNRKDQIITLIRSNTYSSSYYTNSDRLKTDGKFAFVYDEAGNLVKKGNKFNINGETVTFTATSGDGVEYWQYTYDLLNRLIEVSKNGTVAADYEYSPDGLREVKRGSGGTIHYVFEGTEPIFEKRISNSRIRSYVYALGKHLARVDGVIGDSNAKVYYYHTDHEGSIKVVTDATGKLVYNADYFAFGTQFAKDGDFDETHAFTGKEYDNDINLYYYNARFYDSETGRFISEDPKMGQPDNPLSFNPYLYCLNQPLTMIDADGRSPVVILQVLLEWAIGNSFSDPDESPSEFAKDASVNLGTAASGLAVPGSGVLRTTARGAIQGATYSALSQFANTGTFSWRSFFRDISIGAGLGLAAGSAEAFYGATKAAVAANKVTTEDVLQALATKVDVQVEGRGPASGTYRHSLFEKEVKAIYGEDGLIKTEKSFLNGKPVDRGTPGSVRVDVVEYNLDGSVKAVYDLKTGSATLNEARKEQIRKALDIPESVPIMAVKPEEPIQNAMNGTSTTVPTTQTTQTNQTSSGTSGGSNGSGGSGGTGGTTTTTPHKIICAELFRQGLMDKTIYEADEAFGEMLYHKYPIILAGYHAWAKPVVNYMKKSKNFTHLVQIIVKPWSYEMAHIMGTREKGDLIGKVLMYVGFVVCLLVGMIATNVYCVNYLLLILLGVIFYRKSRKYFRKKSALQY